MNKVKYIAVLFSIIFCCIAGATAGFYVGVIKSFEINVNNAYIPAEVLESDDTHTIFSTKDGRRYTYERGSEYCPNDVHYVINVNENNEVLVAWRVVE